MASSSPSSTDPKHENGMRRRATMLGFWRVCDNAACRLGQACRGNVRACSPVNFARVPTGVQAWFALYLFCKEEGLTFAEALARIAETPAAEAMRAWCEDGTRIDLSPEDMREHVTETAQP